MQNTGIIKRHDVEFSEKGGHFAVTVPVFKQGSEAVKVINVNVDPFDTSLLNVVMLVTSPMPNFHANLNRTIVVKYLVLRENQQFDFDGSHVQVVEFKNRVTNETYYFVITEILG